MNTPNDKNTLENITDNSINKEPSGIEETENASNIDDNQNTEKLSYDFVSVQDTNEEEKIEIEGKNNFVWLCLLFIVFASLLFTPAFNVKNIVVKESNYITVEQIVATSGILTNQNILSINTQKAEEKIKQIPLVNTVSIVRKFPATIEITVKECNKTAYISHLKKYICIDEKGKVVEILDALPEGNELTVIKNAEPKEFFLGKDIVLKDADKLEILRTYFAEFGKLQDMPNRIVDMNLKNKKEIYITLDNDISVNMGDISNLAYKAAYLKETLRTQLKTYRGGTLDLSDPENAVRYKGSVQ